jgi:hypothetical protein
MPTSSPRAHGPAVADFQTTPDRVEAAEQWARQIQQALQLGVSQETVEVKAVKGGPKMDARITLADRLFDRIMTGLGEGLEDVQVLAGLPPTPPPSSGR